MFFIFSVLLCQRGKFSYLPESIEMSGVFGGNSLMLTEDIKHLAGATVTV